MFYSARERETALKETSMGGPRMVWRLALGTFETGSDFHVLDLAELPPVPSAFDGDRRHLIEPLRFLHVFADEVSKPIRRNEQEHIEYVPTQIVAEYFRHLYERQTGERVDGIAYRSAIQEGGSNVVLFIDNGDCVDDFAGDDVRKVKLTQVAYLRNELRRAGAPARPRPSAVSEPSPPDAWRCDLILIRRDSMASRIDTSSAAALVRARQAAAVRPASSYILD
jgi:hypothetical protein